MKLFTKFILIIPNFWILLSFIEECKSMDSPTLVAKCNSSCDLCLDIFAQTSANFSYCAIMNSRPIVVCESCVQFYIYLKNSFEEILKQSDINGSCSSRYLDLDRLQVVRSIFNYNDDLWTRAQCNSCFQFLNGGTLTTNLTDDAITFREIYNETQNCITYYQPQVTNEELCSICMDDYLNLNQFYENIKRKNKDTICFDIVDLMNSTRKLWSAELNCCHLRHHPEIIFLVLTGVFALLPILFYVLTKLLTKEDQPAVSPQNRFAESFHTPSTSVDR